MKHEYDMVVIGGGAAGLTAAGMSAVLGAKTALVNAGKLGGECTWHGCVPSKSLLRAARAAHEMRSVGRFGLTPAAVEHDFAQVMAGVREIRGRIYEDADAQPHFEKLGVKVVAGHAGFVDAHTVEVGGHRLTSRRFVVATGSSPRMLGIESDGSVARLTNDTVFELERLPARLVVVGAGPVGIEMAQAFSRLGARVTVVNDGPGILASDDGELTAILLEQLGGEGVTFRFGEEVVRVEHGAVLTSGGMRIEADAVLAAAGRIPNVGGMGLEAAGVATNERGIVVDRRCRTSVRHIFACGDVAGRAQFTHIAEHMAKVAVTNAILRVPSRMDERCVPWTTFTDPELAHVGSSEAGLQHAGVRYQVCRFPFSRLDRAITERNIVGTVKVLADARGRILGASILGAHAGEMIAEYALAMRNGIGLGRMSATIHPYPTWSMGNRRAADIYMIRQLKPWMVRWLGKLLGLRGDGNGLKALGEMDSR